MNICEALPTQVYKDISFLFLLVLTSGCLWKQHIKKSCAQGGITISARARVRVSRNDDRWIILEHHNRSQLGVAWLQLGGVSKFRPNRDQIACLGINLLPFHVAVFPHWTRKHQDSYHESVTEDKVTWIIEILACLVMSSIKSMPFQ